MEIIPKSIRIKMFERQLKSELANFAMKRTDITLNQAHKIGILFDATDVSNHIPISEYAAKLRRLNKTVKIMGYIQTQGSVNCQSFLIFSKKDLNWYEKPNSPAVLEFMNTPFDILINAYNDDVMPLCYLSSFSKAKFRVGPYMAKRTYIADFMIDYKGKVPMDKLLMDIHDYFMHFNKLEATK